MSSKLRLLETAHEKASEEKRFLAFFLKKYEEIENADTAAVLAMLNCSLESYYKLGLCLTPNTASGNYLTELNKICNYIEVPVLLLNQIIKRVDSVVKFSEDELQNNGVLMAARDKNKKK